MDKRASAATALLKALAIGGLAAGTGYGGYRYGANKTADKMTSAFIDANAKENQQIKDSFREFNKLENQKLMGEALRRGMILGANMQAAKMEKKSSLAEIYNEAYNDELEKIAGPGFIMSGVKTLGQSFKNLGSGIKGTFAAASKKEGLLNKLKAAGRHAKFTAKHSKAALGTIGGGVGAAGITGYALKKK